MAELARIINHALDRQGSGETTIMCESSKDWRQERWLRQSKWWGLVTRTDDDGYQAGWFCRLEKQPGLAWQCTYVGMTVHGPRYQADTWVDTTNDLVDLLDEQEVIFGFGLVSGSPAIELCPPGLIPDNVNFVDPDTVSGR